jgi:hypothetical protein
MQNLIELPSGSQHEALEKLISHYNQTDPYDYGLKRVFLLQKINHYIETISPDQALQNWRMALGPHSFEAHLQHYGINRDAATLVKNIQFANAVQQYALERVKPGDLDYFTALQERNTLLANPSPDLNAADQLRYIQYNQIILQKFENDPGLQAKFVRSRHFLSLCYAKMEAIQGVVDQEFETFHTNPLGQNTNNKNFILDVEGEATQLVLRVEDRNSLINEQILQTFPVSDYFSEDYYTIMLPFEEGYDINYRPVVLSEYVEKGALYDYAVTLRELPSEDNIRETVRIFYLLSDFCLKLMESGHYHPDIKLSNFLTDGQTIKVSDRKTITHMINPKGDEIGSSPAYAPPEYRSCLNKYGSAISRFKAERVTFDMPAFMSYQLGMALKEFVMLQLPLEQRNKEMFLLWLPVAAIIPDPTRQQSNLFALIQELTRAHPQDRLSIANFQKLLGKIHLPHYIFLNEIESLSPRSHLSVGPEMELLQQILISDTLSPKLEQKWQELEERGIAAELFGDPRLRLMEQASQEIKLYLKKVDAFITKEKRKKISSVRLIGEFLGLSEFHIEELPTLPIMSPKMIRYYQLLSAMPCALVEQSDMDKLHHIYTRQIGVSSNKTSPLTLASDTDTEEETDSTELDLDTGTCMRVPINDSPSTDGPIETSHGGFDNEIKEMQAFKQKAAQIIPHLDGQPSSGTHSRKVSDIDTTIQRGNKANK